MKSPPGVELNKKIESLGKMDTIPARSIKSPRLGSTSREEGSA